MLEQLTRTNLPPLLSEVTLRSDHSTVREYPITQRFMFCGAKDNGAVFTVKGDRIVITLDGLSWWWND